MSQNMESSEDVCPLDHLSQGTPLEDFGAENISRLFGQEAHMDQNLGEKKGQIVVIESAKSSTEKNIDCTNK